MRYQTNLTTTVPFQQSLSADFIKKELVEAGTVQEFEDGAIILREDAYSRAVPVVLSGVVRVARVDEEGREVVLYYILEGESCILSILSGLHGERANVRAVAEGKTTVVFVPLTKIKKLLAEHPLWLEHVFRLYHKRYQELLEVVEAIAFRKLDERLLDFIRKKAAVSGNSIIHITHEQLANELGTARVVVSRLLKQLERQGTVQLGRNKIVLL